MTITEGLQDIKTISKRIDKKREFVCNHVLRQEKIKDPLAKDGGSEMVLSRELQAIKDLFEQLIKIRSASNSSNQAVMVRIGDRKRSVADWITWKRDVAPKEQTLWAALTKQIHAIRGQAMGKGLRVIKATDEVQGPDDVVVHVNEVALAGWGESTEEMLGKLDGQLSLINATTMIEV